MNFCTTTLGCKVNQVETEAIESMLISKGHALAKPGDGCDVCIINTCAVTAESVRKSRQAVRRMKKSEPDALIAVCGCFSQLESDAAKDLGADIIGGSGDRHGFASDIEKAVSASQSVISRENVDLASSRIINQDSEQNSLQSLNQVTVDSEQDFALSNQFEELPLGGTAGRTRAFLKVQDGCDNFCAYCIIPIARGRVRSLPLDRAVMQAERLAGQGFKEIVITGIEISSYGKDLGASLSVIDVIREIGNAVPSSRIRLGSLDPSVFDESFCNELAKINNLCNHFHLSLQSGCDDTLLRMGRKYTTATVATSISNLRKLFPDCGITADLIVGFPGETDAEFKQTLDFIATARFSDMHIFPFSPRPKTRAFNMPDQVSQEVRRKRAKQAVALAQKNALDFMHSQLNKVVEVLIEQKKGEYWIGNSGNYLEVAVRDEVTKNNICCVRVTDVADGKVLGVYQNKSFVALPTPDD